MSYGNLKIVIGYLEMNCRYIYRMVSDGLWTHADGLRTHKDTTSSVFIRLHIFWGSKSTNFDTIYLRNGLTDLAQILQNFSILSYFNFCQICDRSANPFLRYIVSKLVLFEPQKICSLIKNGGSNILGSVHK